MRSIRGSLGGTPRTGFFAFQDIIMSVTGVLIVIALALALQVDRLSSGKESGNHISTDSDPIDTNDAQLQALMAELTLAQERLEALQAAKRGRESRFEVAAEIVRLEEQVTRAATREQDAPRHLSDLEPDEATRGRAAEILRLRYEIGNMEARLSSIQTESATALAKPPLLEKAVREAESAVIQGRAETKALRLIPEASDTTKEPVIVDLRSDRLVLLRFDHPEPVTLAGVSEFRREIRRFRKAEQYFVIFVRPSSASRFEDVRRVVKHAGFEVGYDAVSEDTELKLGKGDAG